MARKALAVLAAACVALFVCAFGMAQEDGELSKEDAAVFEKLNTAKANIDAGAGMTLIDFMKLLGERCDVNILVDPRLVECGTATEIKAMVFSELPLKDVIKLAVEQWGAAYMVSNGCVVVTAPENALAPCVLRVYDVRDLSYPSPDFGFYAEEAPSPVFSPDQICEFIKSTVERESWEERTDVAMKYADGTITVVHTRQVHEKIQKLLARLREFGKTVVRTSVRLVAADRDFLMNLRLSSGPAASPALVNEATLGKILEACAAGKSARLVTCAEILSHNTQSVRMRDGSQNSRVVAGGQPACESVEGGLLFEVRPTVSSDMRLISLKIRSSFSRLENPVGEYSGEGETIELPAVSRQEVGTSVLVPDGGTVLVAHSVGDAKRSAGQDLVLLVTAAVVSGRRAAPEQPEAVSAADQAVEKKLDTAVNLDFIGMSLVDVLSFLRESMKTNMTFTPDVSDPAKIFVTMHLKNVSARNALKLLLGYHNLTYLVRDGVIIIMTVQAVQAQSVLEVYDVRDLHRTIGDWSLDETDFGPTDGGRYDIREGNVDEIVDQIRETTDRSAWESGDMSLNYTNGVLIAVAPSRTHGKIRKLLSSLREKSNIVVATEALFVSVTPQLLDEIKAKGASFSEAEIAEVLKNGKKNAAAELLGSCAITGYNTQRVTLVDMVSSGYAEFVRPPKGAFGNEDPNKSAIKGGISFDVRPIVSDDGREVTVDVRATISALDIKSAQPLKNAPGVRLPRIDSQRISCSATVPEGKFVLLAGSAQTAPVAGENEARKVVVFLRASRIAFGK